MNIFDYPDGTYRVRVELTKLDTNISDIRWATAERLNNLFRLPSIDHWPYFVKDDYNPTIDRYTCEDFQLQILEILHNNDKESKLNVARKALEFDEKKVDDGIAYAQWKEWAGEIVTLQREDTQWVWEKLQRLRKLEETVDQLRRI